MKNKLRTMILSSAMIAGMGASLAPASASAQEPFIGEIRWVGFNFTPRGWANCDGQTLQISQNTALFSLLGTTYGGDGRTNFKLPDMRGRTPVHTGSGPGLSPRPMGQSYGQETVTLNTGNLPSHTHAVTSSSATLSASSASGNSNDPAGKVLANDGADRIYRDATADVTMSSQAVSAVNIDLASTGNNQPVLVTDPHMTVRCIIALQGLFPSRN